MEEIKKLNDQKEQQKKEQQKKTIDELRGIKVWAVLIFFGIIGAALIFNGEILSGLIFMFVVAPIASLVSLFF